MQRYFAISKEKEYLVLKKEDLHHIKNVMRNKIGNQIECIYKENVYICEIESLDDTKVKILTIENENHELNVDITIAIALVKEQKMDVILQKVTELGINRIIPIEMERSIIKLDKKRLAKKKERWTTICKEAAEQSKRNKVPIIDNLTTLKELVKEDFDIKIICSTKEETNTLKKFLPQNIADKKILFIIGPEGGISPKEEEYLITTGMIPISLGKRIMRVETAAIYIASILNYYSLE